MRIDHLCEALSCCACSIEDELRMQQLMNSLVIQSIFDDGLQKDDVLSPTKQQARRMTRAVARGENEEDFEEYEGDEGEGEEQSIDDLSSNFTARSNFTPANSSVVSFYTHGGTRAKVRHM